MRLCRILAAAVAFASLCGAADAAQFYYRPSGKLIPLSEATGPGGGDQGPVEDKNPDAFSFADSTEVAPGSLVESDYARIAGIDVPVSVASPGGEHRICGAMGEDCGEWSAESSIENGQWLQLRQSSGETFSTRTTMHVSVGDGGADWAVETRAANSPDDFVLADSGKEYKTVWVKITGSAPSYPISLSAVNKGTTDSRPVYWMACPSAGICASYWTSTPTGTFTSGLYLIAYLPIQPYQNVTLTVKIGDMVKTVDMYSST